MLSKLLAPAAVALALIAMSACSTTTNTTTMTNMDTDNYCGSTQEFVLGPTGGMFETDYAAVIAQPGTLLTETTFRMRKCQGLARHPGLDAHFTFTYRGEDGKGLEKSEVVSVPASDTFPPVELKAPNGITLANGTSLSYCVKANATQDLDNLHIFHDGSLQVLEHRPVNENTTKCVPFTSLSIFHHHHWHPKKVLHKVKNTVTHPKKIVKAAVNTLKSPRKMCNIGLLAGAETLGCSQFGAPAVARCTEQVDVNAPALASNSSQMCTALEFALQDACKQGIQRSPMHKMIKSKVHDLCHKFPG